MPTAGHQGCRAAGGSDWSKCPHVLENSEHYFQHYFLVLAQDSQPHPKPGNIPNQKEVLVRLLSASIAGVSLLLSMQAWVLISARCFCWGSQSATLGYCPHGSGEAHFSALHTAKAFLQLLWLPFLQVAQAALPEILKHCQPYA